MAEKSPIDFKNRKWVVYGAAGWPAYITPFAVVPAQRFAKTCGLANEAVGIWRGKVFDWLFDGEQMEAFAEKRLAELLANGWKTYDAWEKTAAAFDKLHAELLAIDLQNVSDADLQSWTERYFESFAAQYAENDFIEPLSYFFQERLSGMLIEEGLKRGEAEKYMGMFGAPKKPNYLKLCTEEYSAAKDSRDVERILRKYSYANNDYTGIRPFTEKDLKVLAEKPPHSASATTEIPKDIPAGARRLLDLLQMTATIQDVRKAQSLMWISGAEPLARETARRNRIAFEDILFATWQEIIEGRLDKNELRSRRGLCVMHWHERGVDVFVGKAAHEIDDAFKKSVIGTTKNISEIKGKPASVGKVIGRVAVVLNVSHFNKVRAGDILVAMMTRPEYLPIMHLASAFVTDEGGITSHAAIVSRELKKPCIIGTKIATKVLKDGDEVEVDAEKGIVRILKRA